MCRARRCIRYSPAEGDREEVDQALAAQAADEGQEPADDAGPGDN
jgi:hypothetical protein